MKFRILIFAAAAFMVSGVSVPLSGQVTTFTNAAEFAEAVNIQVTEDFESFEIANGGAGDTDVSSVATIFDLDGFGISESPTTRTSNGNTYQTIDTVGDNSRDSFGNVDGSAYLSVGLQAVSDEYTFDIDSGYTAIGYDYVSWSNGSHSHAHTFTFADGSTFTVNPKGGGVDFSALGTSGFFGLISNSQLVSLEFDFISTGSIEGAGFDNFVFGTPSAVPEPSSMAALCALAGVGFLRRRRS